MCTHTLAVIGGIFIRVESECVCVCVYIYIQGVS
jgi:hypothetical protein